MTSFRPPRQVFYPWLCLTITTLRTIALIPFTSMLPMLSPLYTFQLCMSGPDFNDFTFSVGARLAFALRHPRMESNLNTSGSTLCVPSSLKFHQASLLAALNCFHYLWLQTPPRSQSQII
ncbi:hypothetical protein GOBAR_DD23649 [Gossypium barbadense]|nr:hypothetical protein GOBAR_DD23649 [Gossypium barbadense]